MPTYNRPFKLGFALFCILRQKFSDFEVLISDNDKTDNTKNVVKKFNDKRIRYFKNKRYSLFVANTENVLKSAIGKYIFFHADDDFLLYENSLDVIHKRILSRNVGYVRINYVCMSPDNKNIFDFNLAKPFKKNKYLVSHSANKKVVDFIGGSDSGFFTGLIFRNSFPRDVKLIDTDLSPWVKLSLYSIKEFGGYFISKPHIVASWSQWRIGKDGSHPLYSVINGKLHSEPYFNEIRKKLNKEEFETYFHGKLLSMYVRILPVIKLYVGNNGMLSLARRLRTLDPTLNENLTYWIYLAVAFLCPMNFLKIARKTYFNIYVNSNKIQDESLLININKMKAEYAKIIT